MCRDDNNYKHALNNVPIINYEKIENNEQFEEYVNNCNIWCVNELPYTVIDYAFNNDITDVLQKLENELKPNILMKLYLYKIKCKSDLCKAIAMFGYIDCLKYVHEKGYPWDEDICEYAAEFGHIECLKYAHEKLLRK